MSLYSQFQTNPDFEKKGIELVYVIDTKTAVILKVARAGGGNTKFQRVMDVKTKPYRRQIQTETIAPEQLDIIMREVYADAVMLGWFTATDYGTATEKRVPTVDDIDGNPMEFKRENVIKLFTDLPDMFSDVQSQAQKVALFRKAELEDSSGN